MILVDSAVGSRELQPVIQRIGQPCQLTNLEYGDACFEGSGPTGLVTIGVERKALHDLLHGIEDSRFAGYQRGGMHILYRISFLAVEGMWRPHDPEGYLMEGFNGGSSWGPCRHRSRTNMYSKVFRYLLSAQLSGIYVIQSRDLFQTAYNICELYEYFQKPFDQHRSMYETQILPLMDVGGRPSLVKRWAAAVDGVGVTLGGRAEDVFDSAQDLANSDPVQWASIRGISLESARRIVGEIRSKRKRG